MGMTHSPEAGSSDVQFEQILNPESSDQQTAAIPTRVAEGKRNAWKQMVGVIGSAAIALAGATETQGYPVGKEMPDTTFPAPAKSAKLNQSAESLNASAILFSQALREEGMNPDEEMDLDRLEQALLRLLSHNGGSIRRQAVEWMRLLPTGAGVPELGQLLKTDAALRPLVADTLAIKSAHTDAATDVLIDALNNENWIPQLTDALVRVTGGDKGKELNARMATILTQSESRMTRVLISTVLLSRGAELVDQQKAAETLLDTYDEGNSAHKKIASMFFQNKISPIAMGSYLVLLKARDSKDPEKSANAKRALLEMALVPGLEKLGLEMMADPDAMVQEIGVAGIMRDIRHVRRLLPEMLDAMINHPNRTVRQEIVDLMKVHLQRGALTDPAIVDAVKKAESALANE